MKINSEQQLASMNKITTTPAVKNEADTVTGNKGASHAIDRVELSITSKDIDQLKNAMQVAPDIGSEKVAQLKAQIAAGTYKVDGNDVATKMLQNLNELK